MWFCCWRLRMSAPRPGLLFAYGNPLLDISADVDDAFLEKYNLKANDAVLADDTHKTLYEEMVEKYKCDYIPGGATLNSVRVTQWLLGKPGCCVFVGCVANDQYGNTLTSKAEQAGVKVIFQKTTEQPTGTCGVLVTDKGKNRSLVANLAAANCFTADHLDVSSVWSSVLAADYYYMAGYPLTVAPAAMLRLGVEAANNNKTLCFNLSAPFLCQFFKDPMMQLLPYVDFLFGNETEAVEFAKQQEWKTENVKEIVVLMSKLPKKNDKRKRVVIITQGEDPAVVAQGDEVSEYPVIRTDPDDIVDTNGAGDAFVGGFLAQLVRGAAIPECVRCGHYAANFIIKQAGVTLTDNPQFH